MNMIKNLALSLILTFSLGAISLSAYAEEASKSSANSPNEAMMYLEKAKVEITHEDFVAPSKNLKAAREASEKITGNPDIVKKANEHIIQAQIKVKGGDKKGATEEMNKALELYKSL